MSINRYAKRKDSNQVELVKQLRQIPALTVMILDQIDLLVGYQGKNYLFEVKAPGKAKQKSSKTDSQKKLLQEWQGQYNIIETFEQCLEILNNGK